MRIAFRTDSSMQMGTGHLMRCLTLADELGRRGYEIMFICRELEGNVSSMARDRGYVCAMLPAPTAFNKAAEADEEAPAHAGWLGVPQHLDAEQTIEVMEQSGEPFDWLIVDHYALDARWEEMLRCRCKQLMVIDDLADRPHECDLLLDQNLYPDLEHRYRGLIGDACRSLLGPSFALLRPEFARERRQLRSRSGEVRRILVFFGGVDAENETLRALRALSLIEDARLSVDVVIGKSNPHEKALRHYCEARRDICLHVQSPHIAELMVASDLAIGAGGVTTWERCAVGLPAIAWPLAENQRDVIGAAADVGALYAPDSDSVTNVDDLSAHLAALLRSTHLCRHMGKQAASLCDGHGTRRVADHIAPTEVVFREARLCDCENVYRWRDHPTTRNSSIESNPIPYETHRTWFQRALVDPCKTLLIAEREGSPVGVLRYDLKAEVAVVSLYLVPGQAGKGIGIAMLRAGETWLSEKHPEIELIQAVVLGTNRSSKALFERCGFLRRQIVFEKVHQK
jgi:UDP-2,4-diacetamido-2,4,6-trideoxy-beta-L-altropyranose hydrolase